CYVHAQALKSMVPWVADIEAQLEARLRQAWTRAEPFPALPERFTTWYRLWLAIELMTLCADELHQLHRGNSRTRWQLQHQTALVDTITSLDAALFHLTNVNHITAGNLRLITPDTSSLDQDEVNHE
ncbi:hypothetical protein, partial [Aeromonas hydrophila]|uniref:hypothetical protein n=1 Tax=Aeromonas hydrophila TaxID=644 RepID=UPI001376866A